MFLKTRIHVSLYFDIILFFSVRVSRFRHSLSDSSLISDRISRFRHSLSDSSLISDRISRFRHSLSDSSLISDRVSRFRHSLSDSSLISDRISRFRHSLSDLPHISDRTQRFPHSLSKSHLISTELSDPRILCPIHPLYRKNSHDSLSKLHQKLPPLIQCPIKKYLLPTKETGDVKFHLLIYKHV